MAVKYTEEQLNKLDKDFIIELFLGLQEQLEGLNGQTQVLNDKMQLLMEQVILGNKNRFGRSSEKMSDPEQFCFMEVDGNIVFFNEAEAVCDLETPEPDNLELNVSKKKKQSGKKAADISGLPVLRIDHYLSLEELTEEFGENGWRQLPDAISRCYKFIPAKVEVEEHHIGVYASKKDEHMVKAPHPKNLLHGSLVSPSLGAAIINGKYVNAVPLYRLEKEFERYGLAISRQNMANWMIRLGEEYLGVMYNYSGICVTDGYQVYHSLEKELEDLRVAGCWVHCRRKFTDALELIPKEHQKESILFLIMKQIQAISREEKKLSELSSEERFVQRQLVVKPLVDALFVYLKQNQNKISKSNKMHEAFTYALNQERYLQVFLEDGDVPMDNNASERAIRGFCIGKNNWEMIDTINGANSSAIIYSIAETAKANNLKPYDYFEYLLTELPRHADDINRDFLASLLPWSETLPEYIRKPTKTEDK